MTHGSLFSGIGGFDLAAEWMGWENIFHCEWNTFGQRVLKHYWPNAISYHDITKTDFTIHRGSIDILTGGFPCQPYSTAGKRLGKEDDRHLWPEMLRAIREIQPRWVVGENVLGLVNWSGGLVFHEVQADLEAEGYEVQPFVLAAVSVNAPHRRDRVWFVAHANRGRMQEPILQHADISSRSIGDYQEIAQNTVSDGCVFGESIEKGAEVRQQRDISAGDTERVRGKEMAGVTADSECNGRRAGTKRKHNNIREWTICSDKSKDGDKVRSEFRDGGCNWVTTDTDGSTTGTPREGRSVEGNRSADYVQQSERREQTEQYHRSPAFSWDASDTNSNGQHGSNCEHEEQSGEGRKYAQRDIEQNDIANTESIGQEYALENRELERERFRKSNERNVWDSFPSVSPICDGDDGISNRLDGITFSKWRQESIKAGGNAVVPQVVLQIFRTIEEYEKMNTQ